MTYGEAVKRLELLVSQIESDNLEVDLLIEKLKEAQELVEFCKEKLYKVDQEIKKMTTAKE